MRQTPAQRRKLAKTKASIEANKLPVILPVTKGDIPKKLPVAETPPKKREPILKSEQKRDSCAPSHIF